MTILIKNLNPEWMKKPDFWYKQTSSLWESIIWRLSLDDDYKEYLSFPFIVELLHQDSEALMRYIESHEFTKKKIKAVTSGQSSPGQWAGTISSSINSVSKYLGNKDFYWIASKNEVDFDINNPKNPVHLVVGNDTEDPSVYAPIVSSIAALCMRHFLKQNQEPTLFQLDEVYTLYLDDLPYFANLFRSSKICMQLGIQALSMLVEKYGPEKANNIITACGNQFIGKINDEKTGKAFIELLSDENKVYNSYSDNDSGSSSVSTSYKREKVINIRNLVEQNAGEFTGIIANGKPAFYRGKIKYKGELLEDTIEVPDFALETENGTLSKAQFLENIENNYNNICEVAKELISNYIEEEDYESKYSRNSQNLAP